MGIVLMALSERSLLFQDRPCAGWTRATNWIHLFLPLQHKIFPGCFRFFDCASSC